MKLESVRIEEKLRRSVINEIRNGKGKSKYMKGIGRELNIKRKRRKQVIKRGKSVKSVKC